MRARSPPTSSGRVPNSASSEDFATEVDQDRWTGLDRELQRRISDDGGIDLPRPGGDIESLRHRTFLIGRLQRLQTMGLAREQEKGVWHRFERTLEAVLRDMGKRGDIIKTMHRALRGEQREMAFFDLKRASRVMGRIVSVGYIDELNERAYVIVDGVDGRAHHIAMGQRDLTKFPIGGIVEAQPMPLSVADRNIAEIATDGLYSTSRHRELLWQEDRSKFDLDEHIEAHVRRLEALRRGGVVERVADGLWRVPADLETRGHAYDRQRTFGVDLQLLSAQPIGEQVRTMAPTWLDRQLLSEKHSSVDRGFGASVNQALRKRVDFLKEQGLAEIRGEHHSVPRNLLTRLRQWEIEGLAKTIEKETGRTHRPVVDGQRVRGVYRQVVTGASGRFALLDDGLGFSLVPWKPVIEQQLGRSISAVVRGDSVSWRMGRELGISM